MHANEIYKVQDRERAMRGTSSVQKDDIQPHRRSYMAGEARQKKIYVISFL